MKIKLILILCFVFLVSCGQSQTDVKGEVFIKDGDQSIRLSAISVKFIKKEKYQNLKNSDISMTDADYFATTDADGKFSVKIPNGEYIAAADKETNFGFKYQWRIPCTATGREINLSLNNLNATLKNAKE